MGRYLDSLTEQFDEITAGIESTLDRAADEGREVTKEEQTLVERDQSRAEELKKAIEHYSAIEVTRAKVADMRAKTPHSSTSRQSTAIVVEREQDPDAVMREAFPTVGDYMQTAARALRGDKSAADEIARATAHQLLADNPGIVPRPILGPIVSLVNNDRPFISSISVKRLPAGSFDRPIISQHVKVGVQAAEKTLTESQKLIIGKLPVSAKTFAGHLNISRQDIKWTQPGILGIVAEDFAHEYSQTSDEDAVTEFLDSVSANVAIPVATFDGAAITAAIFTAAASRIGTNGLPDTFWVSPDIWGQLGGLTNPNGGQVFPSMTPTSNAGNTLGLKVVVDPFFPAGTGVVGPSRLCEWYEDIDGLISVQEPDVLGQLVGYAGFGAFLNVRPDAFAVLDFAPVVGAASSKSSK